MKRIHERFNMCKAKFVYSPLASHFKLSSEHHLTSEKKKKKMRRVPYALVVGSLMYVMICTISVITHAVGVVINISLIYAKNNGS